MGSEAVRRVPCPRHGIPDCSPLLNGCSWNPEERPLPFSAEDLAAAFYAGAERGAWEAEVSYAPEPPDLDAYLTSLIHNAAGPCEPGYHRSMPSGHRCRCGALRDV